MCMCVTPATTTEPKWRGWLTVARVAGNIPLGTVPAQAQSRMAANGSEASDYRRDVDGLGPLFSIRSRMEVYGCFLNQILDKKIKLFSHMPQRCMPLGMPIAMCSYAIGQCQFLNGHSFQMAIKWVWIAQTWVSAICAYNSNKKKKMHQTLRVKRVKFIRGFNNPVIFSTRMTLKTIKMKTMDFLYIQTNMAMNYVGITWVLSILAQVVKWQNIILVVVKFAILYIQPNTIA
ncbi:hypothetical protein SELMODRAFT_418199 [Selaginella moellendorffii]|uniref:Uncharacterized protein n=1 Tax=Selaginella moellendorffii TaxID=88036 RepID=D8S4Z8_SELML|nr:hypothetical protein SELMODRAFT_418199 [Selaginella moellendorffii]